MARPATGRAPRLGRLVAPGVSVMALAGFQAIPAFAATPPTGQTLAFQGIQLTVPAAWPVIRLASDPSRCVRFDQHGLYLGRPGAHQSCPARALGHAEAAIIEPLSAIEVSQAMAALPHAQVAGQMVGMAPRTAIQPDYTLVFPPADAEVVISQGTSPAVAASIFSSLSVAPAAAAPAPEPGTGTNPSIGSVSTDGTPLGGPLTPVPGPSPSTAPPSTAPPSTSPPSGPPATTSPTTQSPTPGPAPSPPAPPLAMSGTAPRATLLSDQPPQPGTYTGEAFDTCEAPSTSTMSAWLASPYRAANAYIGGVNEGCPSQPNLSAAWVAQVSAIGWSVIPTYVGLQAPCASSAYGAEINPAQAATEGQQSADQAVGEASALGLGTGSPIYDDIESYSTSNTSCNQAVLSFLAGWTNELHARGYASGVYSSLYGAISALVSQVGTGYPVPNDLWFAAWPGDGATTNDPTIPSGDWGNHQRIHQYEGNVTQTWGGATITIDQDYADALVAAEGSPQGPPPDNSFQLNAGQARVSPNRQYELLMQGDGNLVLYVAGGRPVWSTLTGGHPGADALMQGDGNLVVYQSGRPLWDSGTGGAPGAQLDVQNDANLVIYATSGAPLWASHTGNSQLNRREYLVAGWLLYSPGHRFYVIMQGDGNLVVYRSSGQALWASNTDGHPGAYAVMQGDGNLVVYQSGRALWSSLTGGNPGTDVVMQDDGNLVAYHYGRALWDTGT